MSSLVDQAEKALQQGRFADAKAALEQALAGGLQARTQVEARSMLGLSMVALGEAPAALEHLRSAVQTEPGEAMFRYNLGRGLEAVGDFGGAVTELREAVRLAPGMPALEVALAQASMRAGLFAEARTLLEKYTGGPKVQPGLMRMLVQAQTGAGDTHAALDSAKKLLPENVSAADPQGRADAMTAAGLAHAAMHYDDALKITAALLQRDPSDAEAATVYGQLALWTKGPESAASALASAREAGASSPRLLVDGLALTDDRELASAAEAMASRDAISASDRADLWLALAQHSDRLGDAEKAWEQATKGKALVPATELRDWKNTLEAQLTIYTSSEPVSTGPETTQHLYLLGVPRSGQSLVQSILAASPDIASAGERGALLQHLLYRQDEIGAMASGQRSSLLSDLNQADQRGLERLLGTPSWMVDKNPLHWAVAGNIARVHPNARFACVLRDPADVAVSIWLRRFPPIYDFANNFEAILDHLDVALDGIIAWREAGLVIDIINFAEFVADPSTQGRALFDALGLAWKDAYLDPANRTEPVPTYSAAQVRKPVGKGGSRGAAPYAERLKPFDAKLTALREKQSAL